MIIDLTKTMEAVKGDQSVPFHLKLQKLGEESGELSQAYLARENAPNASKTALAKDDLNLEVMEEAVDVMLVALDIAMSTGYTVQEIQQMVDKKNEKWLAKQRELGNTNL